MASFSSDQERFWSKCFFICQWRKTTFHPWRWRQQRERSPHTSCFLRALNTTEPCFSKWKPPWVPPPPPSTATRPLWDQLGGGCHPHKGSTPTHDSSPAAACKDHHPLCCLLGNLSTSSTTLQCFFFFCFPRSFTSLIPPIFSPSPARFFSPRGLFHDQFRYGRIDWHNQFTTRLVKGTEIVLHGGLDPECI